MTPRKKATYPPPHVLKRPAGGWASGPCWKRSKPARPATPSTTPCSAPPSCRWTNWTPPTASSPATRSGSSDQGDGDGSSGGDGSTQGGSDGGTGGTQPPFNFTPADPAAAASTINRNASLFDSVLGDDASNFASLVASAVGGQGQSGGTPGVGAAIVIGLPTPGDAPDVPGNSAGRDLRPGPRRLSRPRSGPDRRRRPVAEPVRPRPLPPAQRRDGRRPDPVRGRRRHDGPGRGLRRRRDRHHRHGRQQYRLHHHDHRLVQLRRLAGAGRRRRPDLRRNLLLQLRHPDRAGGDRRGVGPRLGRVGLHLHCQQRQRELRLHPDGGADRR